MVASKKTLFPTDIWIDDWSDLENLIVNLSYQLMDVDMKIMELSTDESSIFVKRVLSTAREYAISIGYKSGYIVFNRAWVRVMTEPVHFVPNHSHPGTWMVGTFYVTEGGGDICFIDPRGAQGFYRETFTDYMGEVHGNVTDYYYTPQKLHAIFFPGYLTHMVMPINKTSEQPRLRMSISWNLGFEQSPNEGWDESLVIKI
jgi:uncharacterized protein (TIGR02466 family)